MDSKLFKHRHLGSSMIEILVATFVLAAGLFGLASLQSYSLKNINNTQFHTLATTYAYDMAERMRSNRAGVNSGAYDAILSSVTDPNCSPCTSTQMATLDGFQWNQQIQTTVTQGGLPNGTGTVTRNGSAHFIVVSWQEQQRSSAGGNVGATNFTLEIQL